MKEKKGYYISSGIFALILIISSVMGLMGNIQAGGFSPFMVINSLSILSLMYLSIILFLKKDNILLGTALLANMTLSLVSVCLSFNFQELFICLTFAAISLNFFIKKQIAIFKKLAVLFISLLAGCIVLFSLMGFINHIRYSIELASLNYLFNFKNFIFYFMPFLYASINATLANLIVIIINDDNLIYEKNKIIRFIPLFINLTCSIVALIIALTNPPIDLTINSFSEVILVIIAIITALSTLSSPFLLTFNLNKRNKKDA